MSVNLPKMIAPTQGLALRQGTVVSVSAGTCTITMAGSTNIIGVMHFHNIGLTAGDNVWLLQNGTDLMIIGKILGSERQRFYDGIEIYHSSSTPYIDFHRAANEAGDASADYNIRLMNNPAGWLELYGNFHAQGQVRAGTGNGEGVIGPWAADSNYAVFAHQVRQAANSSHYGMLLAGGTNNVYIGGTPITFRAANNGSDIAEFAAAQITMSLGTGAVKHTFFNDGEYQCNSIGIGGDNNYNAGLACRNGWMRAYGSGEGWYSEGGAGEYGTNTRFGVADNKSVETQNTETAIMARKISQGGWATAGLENFADAATAVPWITLHASGCCTVSWRKDSNASDIRPINSGGGCDWIYAASYQSCSEAARKRNVSIADEYGLKTLRQLQTKRFQYQPTDEQEIWAWECWKHDRERGVWVNPPSEHMRWEDWHIGYMAEEVVNLVPEIVGLHPDGKPQGIDYSKLVVVAIAAINELADRIEDLEAAMARRGYAAA